HGGSALASLPPATPFTQGARWVNVVSRDLPVGTHVLTARLQVVRGMIDGTEMSVVVRWAASDGNGNPLPPATPAGTVFLRAPAPVITLSPSSIRADSDATFSLTLTLRNEGAAVAIVALALFLVLRRRRRGSGQLIIDDAFVVNEAGILLAHRSASFIQYQDQDILVGMFKVVQDFVKDSFSRGMDEEMQGISFGSRRIHIEKGRHHFVAVVYRGEETRVLRERVAKVSQEIDEKF